MIWSRSRENAGLLKVKRHLCNDRLGTSSRQSDTERRPTAAAALATTASGNGESDPVRCQQGRNPAKAVLLGRPVDGGDAVTGCSAVLTVYDGLCATFRAKALTL